MPWRWHILFIPLKTGRGISTDVIFPPEDLGSGPYTPFIIYIHYSCNRGNQNKLFLRDIHTKSWCDNAGWYDIVIVSCLVSNVHFNCIAQHTLYHNIGIGTMWHFALVSSTVSQSIGLFLGVRCSGVEWHYVLLLLHVFPWLNSISSWFSSWQLWLLLDFFYHSLLFELHFKLYVTKWFWCCKCATPWIFPPLDILLEYWIEHVTFGLLYVIFTFHTKIFYRGVPGFANERPCDVWCRGLTTCLLYVGPILGNLVENESSFVNLIFCCFCLLYILKPHNMIIIHCRLPYFHVSNSALITT